MITVVIYINDRPIYVRSAVNRIDEHGGYETDDGTLIHHDPAKGAVPLAIQMLETIQEPGLKGWHKR